MSSVAYRAYMEVPPGAVTWNAVFLTQIFKISTPAAAEISDDFPLVICPNFTFSRLFRCARPCRPLLLYARKFDDLFFSRLPWILLFSLLIVNFPLNTSSNFGQILTSSPVTHHGTPKAGHTSLIPQFLVGLVQKSRKKPSVQILSQLFMGGLPGILAGVFSLEGFVRGGFCAFPFCQNTSVTIES